MPSPLNASRQRESSLWVGDKIDIKSPFGKRKDPSLIMNAPPIPDNADRHLPHQLPENRNNNRPYKLVKSPGFSDPMFR
jgi:hypothetical protein